MRVTGIPVRSTDHRIPGGSDVRWFRDLGLADLDQVGGKNSSLGEMIGQLPGLGVRVPDEFATTADAYRRFMSGTDLGDQIGARASSSSSGSRRASR